MHGMHASQLHSRIKTVVDSGPHATAVMSRPESSGCTTRCGEAQPSGESTQRTGHGPRRHGAPSGATAKASRSRTPAAAEMVCRSRVETVPLGSDGGNVPGAPAGSGCAQRRESASVACGGNTCEDASGGGTRPVLATACDTAVRSSVSGGSTAAALFAVLEKPSRPLLPSVAVAARGLIGLAARVAEAAASGRTLSPKANWLLPPAPTPWPPFRACSSAGAIAVPCAVTAAVTAYSRCLRRRAA